MVGDGEKEIARMYEGCRGDDVHGRGGDGHDALRLRQGASQVRIAVTAADWPGGIAEAEETKAV